MRAFKYSDVSLIPNFSDCTTRSRCDTSMIVAGRSFKLPVMPANMKAVVNEHQCQWLSENDYLYSMHRFDIDIQGFIENANRENWKTISISLGVKEIDKQIIRNIRTSGARVDIITIDIAHGYSQLMCEMLRFVRKKLGDNPCIIAGNVATPDAVVALYSWGANYVKVGIGQGAPCTTKDKTGFTLPMFTCVKKCSDCYYSQEDFNNSERIPIVADGGIRCNGDIAKALAAGADLVMAGGLFACCSDSPSMTIEIDGVIHKAYYGSASFENKKTQTHVEGTLKNIPSCGLSLANKMIEIKEDLQSAISYAGGNNLGCLKKVSYIEV
ncbi:guanosine monophosphate reductase [Candidatus Woesebacteria bacterium]|nr:guanosine monophosphate reductase [Candidatus Woesebacteria bacterium]